MPPNFRVLMGMREKERSDAEGQTRALAVWHLSNQRKGFQEGVPGVTEVGASEGKELEKTVDLALKRSFMISGFRY